MLDPFKCESPPGFSTWCFPPRFFYADKAWLCRGKKPDCLSVSHRAWTKAQLVPQPGTAWGRMNAYWMQAEGMVLGCLSNGPQGPRRVSSGGSDGWLSALGQDRKERNSTPQAPEGCLGWGNCGLPLWMWENLSFYFKRARQIQGVYVGENLFWQLKWGREAKAWGYWMKHYISSQSILDNPSKHFDHRKG